MKLNYELLKAIVVKVEVIEELNMGHYSDYFENKMVSNNNLYINKDEDIIIKKGAIGEVNVQPHNNWYEIKFEDGSQFDLALEDGELNQYLKGLEMASLNKYFVKEEA